MTYFGFLTEHERRMGELPSAKEDEQSMVVSRLSAPVSQKFEPVGRWYKAYISRRQHTLSSHHSTGSQGSDSLSGSEGSLDSEEEDDKFLLTLDPKESKNQDHYKVLGIGNLRYRASEETVKKAFKKKVLKHHPDKKKSRVDAADKLVSNEDYFTCITIANDVLSNPARRRAYDSIDPQFDDAIPSVNNTSRNNFYEVFDPVFQCNARWSTVKPVPQLGNESSTFEEVDNFYSFWYDFNSWREFSYLDEEEKEKGESRDERRWIEKQNKVMRQKRKKEEVARIRTLVDNAYNCDPRIKKFKDSDKEKRMAEKKAKEEAAKAAAEERERQRLETLEAERKAKEKEELEAKEKAAVAKKEKDKMKNAMKKERKIVRTACKDYEFFVEDEASRISEMQMLDRLLEISSLESLQLFREGMEAAGNKEEAKVVYDKQMAEMRDRMKQEPATQKASASKDSAEEATKVVSDDWTEEQTQLLIKAVKLFPAGTASRWKVIADYVNAHSNTGTLRDSKHVIKKVKKLQKLDPSHKEAANKNAYMKFAKEHSQAQAKPADTTSVRYDAAVSSERTWTSEEQRLLEGALRTYPASTAERWERIAEAVPGRTKKECMKRYKELVEMIKAKKAAQTKEAKA